MTMTWSSHEPGGRGRPMDSGGPVRFSAPESAALINPLPTLFLLEGEGVGGRIKERPEDFVVDEIPLYQPSGKGEHLYVSVRKQGLSHHEAMRALSSHFGVPERRIGFAGMKDKDAVTSQLFSIHVGNAAFPTATGAIRPGLEIAWMERHGNKLRRGHLHGNRFSIRIRGVDPLLAPRAARRLEQLERLGAPNYFGPQRFGYRANNHVLGALIVHRAWQAALDELLGARGTGYPSYQEERRRLYDAGRYAEAAALWSRRDQAERAALNALMRGEDARHACLAIGRTQLGFLVNALQSAVFNRLLDDRIGRGGLATLEPGDLAWKHDSRAVFMVTEELCSSGDMARRSASMEISPSGPLWGPGMSLTSGAVGERELAALVEAGVSPEQLDRSPIRIEGARRPMRVRLQHPDVDSGFDEHGPFVRVAFDLERGAYATVVLREVMRTAVDGGEER